MLNHVPLYTLRSTGTVGGKLQKSLDGCAPGSAGSTHLKNSLCDEVGAVMATVGTMMHSKNRTKEQIDTIEKVCTARAVRVTVLVRRRKFTDLRKEQKCAGHRIFEGRHMAQVVIRTVASHAQPKKVLVGRCAEVITQASSFC